MQLGKHYPGAYQHVLGAASLRAVLLRVWSRCTSMCTGEHRSRSEWLAKLKAIDRVTNTLTLIAHKLYWYSISLKCYFSSTISFEIDGKQKKIKCKNHSSEEIDITPGCQREALFERWSVTVAYELNKQKRERGREASLQSGEWDWHYGGRTRKRARWEWISLEHPTWLESRRQLTHALRLA